MPDFKPAAPMNPPALALRPPSQVMRLARMGCFHQTRLSFMRALMRAVKHEHWRFERVAWQVDGRGAGLAQYRAHGPRRCYTLLCFAHDLPPEQRSDRVIAQAWDATFALYDGIPDADEITRLGRHVPRQEGGQYHPTELVLSRANRSVRLFDYVVAQLASGRQPCRQRLDASGYLMRTTAVYGNGKFGLSDRERIAERAEFSAPFRVELLTVWLIRWFTLDIVEHLAQLAAPERAVKLQRGLARRLGVGNATGLGMAPFLVHHPALLHRWMHARETALARVRAQAASSAQSRRQFGEFLARAQHAVSRWRTADRIQQQRIEELKIDLAQLQGRVQAQALRRRAPWDELLRWSESALSLEGQEMVVTLALEPHGDLVDDLADAMAVDESRHWRIRGAQRVGELRRAIEADYRWARGVDFAEAAQCARFWYVSEEKLEPRLGERFAEPGAEQELPLAFARDVVALAEALAACPAAQSVAEFLLAHPCHRHAVRRAQLAARLPYAEIRDNLISAQLRPVDLLRCKLAFFGATQFDPKSDRWVRITMYQQAPFPDELATMPADDWIYPPLAEVS